MPFSSTNENSSDDARKKAVQHGHGSDGRIRARRSCPRWAGVMMPRGQDSMALPIATTGSVMICNKGTAAVPLAASGKSTLQLCGFLAGVLSDATPGTNITPFGTCVLAQGPCSPNPVDDWTNPMPSCLVGNSKALLHGATLECAVGGTISVVSTSRATVIVNANLDKLPDPLTPETVLVDLVSETAPLGEVLAGATFRLVDGGAYYERWSNIPAAHRTRWSSHPWESQQRIRRRDGSGILFGIKDGDTMVQIEEHHMPESPTSPQKLHDTLGHFGSTARYFGDKVKSHVGVDGEPKNRGPAGTSTHNDKNPYTINTKRKKQK